MNECVVIGLWISGEKGGYEGISVNRVSMDFYGVLLGNHAPVYMFMWIKYVYYITIKICTNIGGIFTTGQIRVSFVLVQGPSEPSLNNPTSIPSKLWLRLFIFKHLSFLCHTYEPDKR